jgi:hypothetical protein
MAGSGLAHYVKADELRRGRGESGHIQRDRDLACDPGRRSCGSCCGARHRAELVWSR